MSWDDVDEDQAVIERLTAEVARLRRERDVLAAALTEISEQLPCDKRCKPAQECHYCGATRGGWCAGCTARDALAGCEEEGAK